MGITQPLDLWEIIVNKLAGQEIVGGQPTLSIFFFLAFLVISITAIKFRITAMGLFLLLSVFSFMMYAAEPTGIFVGFVVISIFAFVLLLVMVLKRALD